LASVLQQNHTRVLDLFRAADADGDGEISHSELSRLLRKLGVECSQGELAQLFETLDPDRSGGIEYHELQRALQDAAPQTHARPTNGPSPPSKQSGTSKGGLSASRPDAAPHLHQGPPTAAELRVLEEMINEAAAAMAKRAGSPGGMINLVRVLSAYEVVLQRHGLVPVEDTRYYHLVLQMSLLPQPDWRAKLVAMRGSAGPARAPSPPKGSRPWITPGGGDSRASTSLPGSPTRMSPNMMRTGSPLARHGARPPFAAEAPSDRDTSPLSSPRGYGKIRRPSELAMRIGMLACDAQSPAMRSQAKHLRAALRFDRTRMTPEEAEAYSRFRLSAIMFRAWHALASESANAQKVFQAALARWVNAVSHWERRLCQQCLVEWAGLVGHQRRTMHECAGIAARNSMKQHWFAFRVAYRQRNLDKKKVIAALAHWGLRLAIVIFAAWRNLYLMERSARLLFSSGSVHHRSMALKDAWRVWRGRNAQGAEYRRKAFMLASNHSGVVRQIMFVAWRAHTASNVQLRGMIINTVRLTRLRHLLAAWRGCDSQAKSDRHKVDQALRRMMNAKLAAGFLAWLAVVEQIASDKATMLLCVRRFTMRAISAALRTWQAAAEESFRLQEVARKVVRRMMNALAFAVLNAWREAVRKRNFLTSVGERISGNKRVLLLSGAMNRWLGEGDEQRDKEAKLRRALGSFAHRLLFMAWNGWMTAVQQAADVRRRLIPFAARICNRLASLSFDAWSRYLDHRHGRRDDSRAAAVHRARTLAGKHLRAWREQHDKFQRAARHMLYGAQARALASWRELAGRGSRKGDLMRSAVASLRCRELRAATNTWLELIERNRRLRGIVMRMTQGVLCLCFAAWAGEVEASKEAGAAAFSKAEKVARHFLNSAVSRAFHTLQELVERRTAMRAILRRLKHPALNAAIGSWKRQNAACHEHARKLRRAANFMVNGERGPPPPPPPPHTPPFHLHLLAPLPTPHPFAHASPVCLHPLHHRGARARIPRMERPGPPPRQLPRRGGRGRVGAAGAHPPHMARGGGEPERLRAHLMGGALPHGRQAGQGMAAVGAGSADAGGGARCAAAMGGRRARRGPAAVARCGPAVAQPPAGRARLGAALRGRIHAQDLRRVADAGEAAGRRAAHRGRQQPQEPAPPWLVSGARPRRHGARRAGGRPRRHRLLGRAAQAAGPAQVALGGAHEQRAAGHVPRLRLRPPAHRAALLGARRRKVHGGRAERHGCARLLERRELQELLGAVAAGDLREDGTNGKYAPSWPDAAQLELDALPRVLARRGRGPRRAAAQAARGGGAHVQPAVGDVLRRVHGARHGQAAEGGGGAAVRGPHA